VNRTSLIVRTICLVSLVLVGLVAMPASQAAGELDGVKVCLDPGHGDTDPGAVNETFEPLESEINLDVATAFKALLECSGAEVVLTRTDESYLDNRDRYTFCYDQQATLLVSVHTNSSTDPTLDGTMALYFKSEDKVLAQVMYDAMYPALKGAAPDPDTFIDWASPAMRPVC
jgi:N-acetylmuramoyl-L-alanine amidase